MRSQSRPAMQPRTIIFDTSIMLAYTFLTKRILPKCIS